MVINGYHSRLAKRMLDLVVSLFLLVLAIPLFLLIPLLIKFTSPGPVFFRQKRCGKNGKSFTIIKFRSMKSGAEGERSKIKYLNEVDGPVFKMVNDPRFTSVGRVLSRTGMDELPQFLNVIKGNMSIVGPRPLPVYESRNLPKKFSQRNLVNPGITSSWVINGSHTLSFNKWMRMDLEYVSKANFGTDIVIMYKTAVLIVKLARRYLLG